MFTTDRVHVLRSMTVRHHYWRSLPENPCNIFGVFRSSSVDRRPKRSILGGHNRMLRIFKTMFLLWVSLLPMDEVTSSVTPCVPCFIFAYRNVLITLASLPRMLRRCILHACIPGTRAGTALTILRWALYGDSVISKFSDN